MSTLDILQIFSLMYIGLGVVMLARPYNVELSMQALLQSRASSFLVGFMSLLLGAFILHFHNLWTTVPEVVVSVFGWSAFIKGVLYLGFSEDMRALGSVFVHNPTNVRIMGALTIALSLGLYTISLI